MRIFCLITILGWCFCAKAQTDSILSPRTANYDIKVELDIAQKKIYGQEKIVWKNPSQDTVKELQFHLYHNAFRNTESTFYKERGFASFLGGKQDECHWAWQEVQKIVDNEGNDLTKGIEYIHPDDDNEEDKTVIRVPLLKPVLPGGSTTVDLEWIGKIPKIMPRTGYNKEYYFMVQWFPKLGVYEPKGMRYAEEGGWNCHQYHSIGEYYADFGVYNVEISVPKNYVVGASGELQQDTIQGNKKIYSYQANDVIDFAWTASPHFVEQRRQWNHVDIRLLTYPVHEHFGVRYLDAMEYSLEYMSKHVGAYPYTTLTIVDTPFHGIFSTGMEYPTLITVGSVCFLPKGVKTTETLAVHEFVHQYFMQMVATHEVEEPWMDEGMTTYYEGRIMDHYYGEQTATVDVLGFKCGNVVFNRWEFFGSENKDIADGSYKSYEFKEGGYKETSYNKTAIALRTLQGLIGENVMDTLMSTYFDRWKFKHPSGRDFIEVANEVVQKHHGDKFGENLDWFFDQVLYGSDLCDYEIESVHSRRLTKAAGYVDNLEDCAPVGRFDGDKYESKVTVRRNEPLHFPVDILVVFEDGTTVQEQWDGKARSKTFRYIGQDKVIAATVDPEQKIHIDKNFLNNSFTVNRNENGVRKYANQFLLWLQNSMQTLSVLI